MTDRELLELAAKAAGLDIEWQPGDWAHDNETGCEWNPLTGDGDALRLAVKIYMFDGSLFKRFMTIRLEETRLNPARSDEEITRRAIVRVAAEIGKKTNEH